MESLTIRDVGILSYRLRSEYLLNLTKETNVYNSLIRSSGSGIGFSMSGNSININCVDACTTMMDIHNMIQAAIICCFSSEWSNIVNTVASFGYQNPVITAGLVLERCNMFYTLLQIGEGEFNVIFL